MPILNKPSGQPLPEIVGYKMLRVLGNGGMSTVYLAQQLSLGREVAIKVMLPEALADETGRRRFENEARTIARLDHPHIVKIHEVGRTAQGLPYYVMAVLRRGHIGKRHVALDESKVRNILQALLSALGYAHSRGVIHRDVKAENVLFDEADRAMLTDFGIALRRGHGSRVTTDGVAVGSTAYMAPEQARGAEVDLRADLYSLAVLGWEMLVGSLPYQATDALSMALKHLQDPIPRLPAELSHWQRFFDRALAKAPIDRFPDAPSMLDAMHQVPHAERQPMRAAFARLRSKFTTAQWLMAGGAVAAIAVAGVLWMPQRQRPNPPAPQPQDVATAAQSGDAADFDPTLGAPEPDPTGALLRAAPESAAQPYVGAAQEQLQQRRLISPAGNNAYESVMTAWSTDPSHPSLSPLTTRLVDQLCSEAARRVRQGEDASGKDLLDRAQRLSQQNSGHDAPRLNQVRKELNDALTVRMTRAVDSGDRKATKTILASAKAFDLPSSQIAALQAKSTKTAPPVERVVAVSSGEATVTLANGKTVAVSRVPISRDNYADFAKSTQRPAALCRERVSLLRVIAPRTWESPGFSQSGNQAAVCVSWQDADAYARWHSQRKQSRYRLPTAAEAQAVAKATAGKAVAEWVTDCGAGGCGRRMTNGKGWRTTAASGRALDAARGYDDVGFRLVREL
ncbi:MAG: protein kinase [Xanthomonadaceae bacterium]|nr:protein kinase [Xanthomonadaceae bacterium]